ncbi:MAG: aminopeptidase [Nitrososphaerales archaeon]|nr:aminopeptidase [Nitrososphaerales archaeon]
MPTDSRLVDKVAQRVLSESLRLNKGENITIEAWNNGLHFAQRTLVHARRLGAIPLLLFEDEGSYVEGLRGAPRDIVGKMGRHEYALLSATDAYVFIPGPVLGGSPKLSREEVVASTSYNSSWYKAAKSARLRGARLTFGYAGMEMARVLRKSLAEIVEHQLKASLVDFRKIRQTGRKLAREMVRGGKATIMAEDEVLNFELGGEEEIDDGMVDRADVVAGNNMTNIPPGYLAKEVRTETVSGAVRLHAPLPRLGTSVDLRLEFAKGKLKTWKSERNQEWLDALVKRLPDGRRTFSSIVVGLNPSLSCGYAQDRLVEGAITLFGLFQGTTKSGSVTVNGRLLVDEGKIIA